MGKFSRDKGKAGEREFSALCRSFGFYTSRTAQCKGKTGQAGDVEGLPGIHVEVKRVEKLDLWKAMMQSDCDCRAEGKGNMPIVAHRKNRQEWLVTMLADDFLDKLHEFQDFLEGAKHENDRKKEKQGALLSSVPHGENNVPGRKTETEVQGWHE